jgi:HEAT repeat protein
MLEAPSESQRLLAILGLGFSKDEQAVPQLSNLLDDASLAIGRAVCLALAAIGNKAAIESLAWALLNSGDTIRQSAAEALAKIPEDGYPILEEGSQMEDLLVRRAVISGLVHVDLPRANQILEKLAIEDKEWVVRAAAMHALDQLKSPELHIPHNLPALSESAWLIAFAGELGLGVSPGKPADDLLRKALRAGTEEQKLAALDYLRLFGTQGDIPLIQVIQQNFPGELREAAFNTIWHLGAAGIMPA